jgi:hypothetical protein
MPFVAVALMHEEMHQGASQQWQKDERAHMRAILGEEQRARDGCKGQQHENPTSGTRLPARATMIGMAVMSHSRTD